MNAERKIIIKCLPRSDGAAGMMFWCPFCHVWHYHGSGKGYRNSHCRKTTPLSEGYYIKMASKTELKEIAKSIKSYREQKE